MANGKDGNKAIETVSTLIGPEVLIITEDQPGMGPKGENFEIYSEIVICMSCVFNYRWLPETKQFNKEPP